MLYSSFIMNTLKKFPETATSHPQEAKRIAYHFQAYVYWDGLNQVNQPTELKLGSTSLFGYVTPKKKKGKENIYCGSWFNLKK